MKKTKTKAKPVQDPTEGYPQRLVDLETELRSYPTRPAADRILSSIETPEQALVGKDPVVQFQFGGKSFATGYTDRTYAASNHARGVRYISFYEGATVVLSIEGDFEDQQFGSNFKFHSIKSFTAGPWQAEFIKLTDDLNHQKEKRRLTFRKKRASQKSKELRGHSYT